MNSTKSTLTSGAVMQNHEAGPVQSQNGVGTSCHTDQSLRRWSDSGSRRESFRHMLKLLEDENHPDHNHLTGKGQPLNAPKPAIADMASFLRESLLREKQGKNRRD